MDTTLFSRYYENNKLISISMAEMEALIEDESNKELIAQYVYERLYNRFLKIFDYKPDVGTKYIEQSEYNIFRKEYKNGFLMMAGCSLLIETFASFLRGCNETPRQKNKEMFQFVFNYAEQKDNDLKVFKDEPFYKKIRCGILHQGETYKKYKITRKGLKLFESDTVDAFLFHKNLKLLLLNYRKDLTGGDWMSCEWKARRRKIKYIIANSKE